MTLKLYSTLTRKKEAFKPIRKKEARMYNCGPTCYSYAHIGNFRSFVFADLLRRYLEWKGFKVMQIMNITDVGHMTVDDSLQERGEDKIEKSARESGQSPKEIADFYTFAFFEDIGKLNLRKAYFYPRATDHIREMQGIISALLEKGMAYKRNGNVYFEIKKFPAYGKLSGNRPGKLQAGKRVRVLSEKKSPFDFALWKKDPKHLMQWDSPWGRGFPGWHIECSAMGLKYLGDTIDIHTGGEDNIFPHHECEIAQSESFTGKRFANYWLHTRHLLVNGKKMSKSLGNFYTLRDLLEKGHGPREIRFLLLSAHYRTKLNFTEKGLKSAKKTLSALEGFVSSLKSARGRETKKVSSLVKKAKKVFESAMDDDLNIPKALSGLFGFVREINALASRGRLGKKNAREVLDFVLGLDRVLGLNLADAEEKWIPPKDTSGEVKELILKREEFRKEKNWQEADKIRNLLKKKGILLEDTKQGPRWKKGN